MITYWHIGSSLHNIAYLHFALNMNTNLTYFIILILFLAVSAATEDFSDMEGNDSDVTVTVSYTLWIGTEILGEKSVNVTAPQNSSFYNVMQLAINYDPAYDFRAKDYPNIGHYIYRIAGHDEDTKNNIYWIIYKLKEKPDKSNLPTNKDLSPVGCYKFEVQTLASRY
ncbi:uncharacterized protein CG3556-like isoform X2 [Sitophilus oryzae]|uniref:Uncharacterized protein CG3556-like isoform X2 n=1 Tax=Sitophilus oryzae TaxID=7048 RepID=A0A6J2XVI7_SITOR|nr:uncharacterized protein CG3556-like isoform X2 [Sitophilus oryzae]